MASKKKKSIISIVVILILVVVAYWGWNEYSLNRLKEELTDAVSAQSSSADSAHLEASFATISGVAQKATTSHLPLFTKRYFEINSKCKSVLQKSPSKVAEWVKAQRVSAWSHIGRELQPKSMVDDKEVIQTVYGLKGVCQAGLAAQDKISDAVKKLGLSSDSVRGMPDLASQIQQTSKQAKNLAHVGQEVAKLKGQARSLVQEGLRKIDNANRRIEKFAEISTLRQACYDWEAGQSTIMSAMSKLSSLPSFPQNYQNQLAKALVESDRDRIKSIVAKIKPHVSKVRLELAKAERQESTVAGRTGRRIGRFLNRTKDKFTQSRIGKEATVSFKTMVLGTKMFYGLMDMDSSTDIVSWAQSYESDMEQLMGEMDEIQSMDGWSLTGKNTFIESFTDKAYEQSFRK